MTLAPLFPVWIAVLVAAVLAGAGWWTSRQTLGRWARTAACLSVAIGWLALGLRPAVRGGEGARHAVVVTAGAGEREATRRPGTAVFDLRGPASPDLGWVLRRHPALQEVTVVGEGLEAWQFQGFTGRLRHHPSGEASSGWLAVDWNRRLDLGTTLVVRGRVSPPSTAASDRARVELTSPGGEVSTAPVAADGTFRASARPKLAGRQIYCLRLREGEERLDEESVDVVVRPPRPPRLLWLESAPDFESRHFEAWLGGLGGPLALRSQLAPGIARGVERGRALSPSGAWSGETLDDLDVLVLDTRILAAHSAVEMRVLEEAVRSGLGLLLRVEEGVDSLPRGPWMEGLELTEGETSGPAQESLAGESWQVHLELPDLPGGGTAPPLELPRRELTVSGSSLCQLADRAGRCLAASRALGLGTVAATLVSRSYRWKLGGWPEVHQAYWSALLAAVARPLPRVPAIEVPSGPVFVGHPLRLALWADGETPTLMHTEPGAEPARVALLRDERLAVRWTGTVWPRAEGWHCLGAGGSGEGTSCFYAVSTSDWAGLGSVRRLDATARRAVLGGGSGARGGVVRPRPVRRLPRWPFVVLVVGGAGSLWVAARPRP